MTRVTNFLDTMEQSDIDARKSRSTVQYFLEPVSRCNEGNDDDALDDGE